MYFVPNGNIWDHMTPRTSQMMLCVTNDITSMEIPISGAPGVVCSILQHSRSDSLAAYVTIAAQVITHSPLMWNKVGLLSARNTC